MEKSRGSRRGKEAERGRGRKAEGRGVRASPGVSVIPSQLQPGLMPSRTSIFKSLHVPSKTGGCFRLCYKFGVSFLQTKAFFYLPCNRTCTVDQCLLKAFLLKNNICGGTERVSEKL